uniref:HECT-type E3 ubiquitin transferase n=1 Tax=Arcella intermedia TaxID=1963864 RepID=A0A6B2LGV1_9EUKA
MQYLLDYEGNVEETFGQYFEVTEHRYGVTEHLELMPNGSNTPVTNENRVKYVELYVDYLLNKSVQKQFSSFQSGLLHVCGKKILEIFTAEELELCVCGEADTIDTITLEKGSIYKGFHPDQPYMKQFWNIVHNLSSEQKKKLLLFTTGTDRLPIGGIKTLQFIIQRNGSDTEQLPTAMTCFHVLLLPEYSSHEKLKSKLLVALENCKGFGLR